MIAPRPVENDVWEARHHAVVPRGAIRRFVAQCTGICLPDMVYWCDGSNQEQGMLASAADAESGDPDGALSRCSDFSQAPVKTRLSVAPSAFADWDAHCNEQRALHALFRRCMEGRTMYVVPFLAPANMAGRGLSGVQVTDSAGAALSIERFCPHCDRAWTSASASEDCICILHSRGCGYSAGRQIYWFPRQRTMWAYGAGYDVTGLLHAIDVIRARNS